MTVPVKLPKEVLNLFPTWEYRCPCCNSYVESNVSLCPNCKTPFDENKWRVPPRFLKSHDAMSEYAHKVLAPKLTQKQRELLFQYFTELFSDGFESGDFSEWTGTSVSSGCIGEVITTDPHHGSYHAHFKRDTGGSESYVYKTLSSEYTVHVRGYFKFKTFGDYSTYLFRLQGGSTDIASAFITEDSGDWYLGFSYREGSARTSVNDDTTALSLDTWYCIELYINVAWSPDGECILYLDGEELVSATGKQTNVYGAVAEARVGFLKYWGSSTLAYYVDCVVVADTYIGPETTEQTYTKTWTTDALFKKLGIPKILGVDTAFQKQDVPETFGVDVAFQKSFFIQKQVDAFFKKFGILKNFAVDARFGAVTTQTVSRQVDALFKKLDATATFGLDTHFGAVETQAYTETFGLDVVFAHKVRLPEVWLDENGRMVLNISRPYAWVGT